MINGFNNLKRAIKDTVNHALSNLHTATIAKVTSVGSTTINCQPVINRYVNGENIKLPEFIEVPPVFMYGGSSYTAHPISVGDYCLLIFTERCFDRWYVGDDCVLPAEYRMHDYSDGFAIVGVLPQGSAISIPNDIHRAGDTTQEGDITRTGSVTQTGDFTMTGNHTTNGNSIITGTLGVSGLTTLGAVIFSSIQTGGNPGVSGSFTSDEGKTITVTNGIITGIV